MDNTFFHILTYFVIYSFLGWILESTVRTICERKIINTGFLIGPFCPIYGFGAIIMILFLDSYKNNIKRLWLNSSEQGKHLYMKKGFLQKNNEMELFL